MTDDIIERAEACTNYPYVPPHVAATIRNLIAALKAARAENERLRREYRHPTRCTHPICKVDW